LIGVAVPPPAGGFACDDAAVAAAMTATAATRNGRIQRIRLLIVLPLGSVDEGDPQGVGAGRGRRCGYETETEW
jgi:hypothetical protein